MLLGLFAKFLAFWRNSVVYGKLCDLYPACGGIIKCWCYLMLGPGLDVKTGTVCALTIKERDTAEFFYSYLC